MSKKSERVVWITGASSGIGEALVYQYNSLGYRIVISARREQKLQEVKAQCKFPEQVMVLPLDLTQSETFPKQVNKVLETYGQIDILINNGGISQRSETLKTPLSVDRKIMEINYFGNIALAKAVLPTFRKQQSGHLVIISSLTGLFGFYLRSAYAASKHALHGFYESLRLEEEKNGLQVTIVCPGFINTDISKNAIDASGNSTGEMDENQAQGMSPEDCAQQIVLAQQKNKYQMVIGKEKYGVLLLRFFPKLFWKVLKKKSAK